MPYGWDYSTEEPTNSPQHQPHHHQAQFRPTMAHHLLLINFTLRCSNIAEIRPCDEGTFVESSAETLSTMLDTADLIRLVLISSCSNQMITFEPENLFWAETDGAVLSVHVPVHEAGDRHSSRKQ